MIIVLELEQVRDGISRINDIDEVYILSVAHPGTAVTRGQ